MILALALTLDAPTSAPIERRDAMERCAEAVMAKLHPNIGMADVTGTKFEWLQVSAAGDDWVIIGSIIEPAGTARLAHRFTCRTRGTKPPHIGLGKVVLL